MLRIWAPGLAPPGSDAGPLASATSTGTGPSWSSAPGAPLVSGAEGARVSLWDPDLTAQAQLEGHAGEIRSVAVSPDGTLIASGADHGELILWDARRRTLLARLEGHQGAVRSVAFSADGQQLASAGDDSTVRVWDVPAGSRLAVLRGHRRGVSEVAFAADGALLASRGEDQLIRLWRVDAWREVALLPDRVPERRPRGLAFHPYRPWLAVPDAAVIRICGAGAGGPARRALTGGQLQGFDPARSALAANHWRTRPAEPARPATRRARRNRARYGGRLAALGLALEPPPDRPVSVA